MTNMNSNDNAIVRLRQDVERHFGHEVTGPHDFVELCDEIAAATNERISVSTLKRLWGYVEGYDSVRLSTLGVLARYVGCRGWSEFCDTLNSEETSEWNTESVIPVSTLRPDDRVEITWQPGRRMVAQYLGQGRFRVMERDRCKLVVGDTFSCAGMVCGERLVLTQVEHAGNNHVLTYVCGKKDGIQARKLNSF